MICKQYIIKSENGINVKLAEEIVDFVSSFECDVFLAYNNVQINMKSIMGFISLIITAGSKVDITFSGIDEEKAASNLDEYLKSREIVK